MKSRTSSCKKAALRKDLSRFWPVWAGYILCLIILQVVQSNSDLSYWYAANMADCISVMGVVNCGYALVVAEMLFGDLFNTRMCNGLHTLPLRREHWFGVHLKAGFLFSLLPTALTALFSEWIIARYSVMVNGWQIPLYWFAASNIQYVFFFGLAVFCAMCVGSRFAMVVVYGILNAFSLLIYLLVDRLYTPLLYGVVTQAKPFTLLCPMYQIAGTRFLKSERVKTGNTYLDQFGVEQQEYIGTFTFQSQGWVYIAILALIGIALLLTARQMYKKRHLECAGDFIAVRWLEPVFQVVFSILCASGFYAVFLLFFGLNSDFTYVLVAIGLTVGWFAGRMFLERSTRVFRFKNFAGFALLAALLAGSLYMTKLDPLGIETWVPEAEKVAKAQLYVSNASFSTEDPEEIRDLLRLHEVALEQRVTVHDDYSSDYYNPDDEDPEAAYINLSYWMENGWYAQRRYYVLVDSEGGDITREYGSRMEAIFTRSDIRDADDLRYFLKDSNIALNSRALPEEAVTEEFLRALAEAIAADCESGAMIQSGVFHPVPFQEATDDRDARDRLYLDINNGETNFYTFLYIYTDCENILSVLDSTGIVETVLAEYYG